MKYSFALTMLLALTAVEAITVEPVMKKEKPKKEKESKNVYQEKKSEPAQVSESQESLVAAMPEKLPESKLKFVQPEKVAPLMQSEIQNLQQLLMAKEKEIGRLQKHMDKQDSKLTQMASVNAQLKEQLASNANGSQL